MKKLLILLVFACASASAQTTFILVRHAEKESAGTDQMMAKDPPLSKAGQERAQSLVRLLEKQRVDAIYSTNYNRTKNTVKPVADAKGIAVQTYESLKVDELIEKHKGGTVLICGHSNTVPGFANTLLGKKTFENFDDSDYGNFIIITVSSEGRTLTHLRY
jgi:broad specificity phosphatase PhoE